MSDEDFNNLIEELVAEEITKGVQMIQYQINTLMTSNGQTPFCSLFIYLKEAPEGRERDDLALVASEIFRQRIKGIKNKKGAWVAPAFPKLLYVLDTENHDETCKYWYLTKLAAECTAKRMVPDYISEKIMNSYKEGNTYGCMGAVHKDSVVHYKINGKQYVGTIKNMYENVKNTLSINEEDQFNQVGNPNKDINLKNYNVEIFDSGEDRFVKCEMMNKNVASNFKLFKITIDCDGVEKTLIATNDHPLMSPVLRPQYIIPNLKYENEDVLHVEDLEIGDKLYASRYVSTSAEGLLAGCATPCLSTVTKIEELTNDEDFVYDVTTETGHFMVNDIFSHNCRAFLSVWRDPDTGIPKFYGRYNKQVCTVNLPDVALTIRDKYYKDGENLLNNKEAMKEFWKLLDERLEMAHKVLLVRINYLKGTKSDVAPILWQYGAIARLKPGETIDKTLSGGYSTASLGFVGLWETLMALTDKPHTDPENMEFAESVVRYMKERCDEWNKIPGENYGFSLYGTPEESTTYKFAKALRSRHGIVKNVTDKDYVLNSYHTNVKEHVDAFTKLSNEAHFQKWTNAGAISYIEMPNLINNQEAILSVMKYIYEHCWYAELNSKIDNCHKCGFSGEIKMIRNENNKLVWECPQCGNRDIHEMTVVRRVCGYLSNANAMNEGRLADIHDRVLHL